MKTALVVTVAALLLAGAAAADAAPTPPARGKFLPYEEAKARGYRVPPLPRELGLPACDATTPDPGFESAEEAEQYLTTLEAIFGEDGPGEPCLADPRLAVVRISGPRKERTPCCVKQHYRFGGTYTLGKFEGGRDTIEVGNPEVQHTDCVHEASCITEFFAARPLAKTAAGNWTEVGWVEQDDLANDQYVYRATMENGSYDELIWQNGYPLTVGNYYIFRVRQYGSAGELLVVGEIFWGGSWDRLVYNTAMRCQNGDGSGNCKLEFFSEAYSENDTWFDLNAPSDGAGVNHRNAELRVNPNDWRDFNNTSFSGDRFGEYPYSICWGDRWFIFRTPRGVC